MIRSRGVANPAKLGGAAAKLPTVKAANFKKPRRFGQGPSSVSLSLLSDDGEMATRLSIMSIPPSDDLSFTVMDCSSTIYRKARVVIL